MIFDISDAGDYIGGKPNAAGVVTTDTSGRFKWSSVPTMTGLNIASVISTDTAKLGFYGVAPIAQQQNSANLSVAFSTATGWFSAEAGINFVMNSTNAAINRIFAMLSNVGLGAS